MCQTLSVGIHSFVRLIQFHFNIMSECRIVFQARYHHGTIAILGQIHRLAAFDAFLYRPEICAN